MDQSYDLREIYCRRLGHYLTFRYCRTERLGLPCSRIRDCWFEKIPIETFLQANYAPAELAELAGPPPPKTVTLVELIEQARRRKGDGDPPGAAEEKSGEGGG